MLLIIIPICLATLFSLAQTNNALERTMGTHFKVVPS